MERIDKVIGLLLLPRQNATKLSPWGFRLHVRVQSQLLKSIRRSNLRLGLVLLYLLRRFLVLERVCVDPSCRDGRVLDHMLCVSQSVLIGETRPRVRPGVEVKRTRSHRILIRVFQRQILALRFRVIYLLLGFGLALPKALESDHYTCDVVKSSLSDGRFQDEVDNFTALLVDTGCLIVVDWEPSTVYALSVW